MNFKDILSAVKIPVKPYQIGEKTFYVRALTGIEEQDGIALSEKWAKERAKTLGTNPDLTSIKYSESVKNKDGREITIENPLKREQVAIYMRLLAMMSLCDENGKPISEDPKELKEATLGENKLPEKYIREILAIREVITAEQAVEEKNQDEKN